MSRPNTFTLHIPTRKPVEVTVIEREDGQVIARTADELRAAADAPEPPRRG